MRGSSGARFTFAEHTVRKHDTERTGGRVVEQGRWLRDNAAPALPVVHAVHPTSYTMERLTEVTASPKLMAEVIDACAQLWCRPARQRWNGVAHWRWIAQLLNDTVADGSAMDRTLLLAAGRLPDPTTLYGCLTHGDPIIDNVLWRESSGELVVIDPIPATGAVPDVLSSDVGRLMQSAYGYERARYGEAHELPDVRTTALLAYDYVGVPLTDTEYSWCLYWAAVHTLRGVRTAPTNAAVRDVFTDALLGLELWTG